VCGGSLGAEGEVGATLQLRLMFCKACRFRPGCHERMSVWSTEIASGFANNLDSIQAE